MVTPEKVITLEKVASSENSHMVINHKDSIDPTVETEVREVVTSQVVEIDHTEEEEEVEEECKVKLLADLMNE